MTNMWPNRAVMVLAGEEKANQVGSELEYDSKIFSHIKGVVDQGTVLKAWWVSWICSTVWASINPVRWS